jgi:hypothetical protein
MQSEHKRPQHHRMPEQSLFFDKVVPVIFILTGLATAALILFAIGVVTGVINWI